MGRVKPSNKACARYGKTTAAVESKSYLSWIRTLPCLVSGGQPVEAAHLNTASREWAHPGRGKARRSSDRWALPLTHDKHQNEQHKGAEMAFWSQYGIDPHRAATILFAMHCERGEDATELATEMILNGEFHNNNIEKKEPTWKPL